MVCATRLGEHGYTLKARELHQTNSGLPSSTVDVDKLAEVLNRDECYDIPYGRFDRYSAARAVAEWLGGEGR